ncbi:hypothetical protein CAPTEDRAFT_120919 [Capitella teleta]|uniref:Methyltransferase-like protein 23 n=1 Tax=Capitella teleta TaxID=283909 RepID=R7TTB1_CAPTE|nr:hypothetical protein CAPTEDRAFT_120919 [Capitella teleta]|eukprot:ELT96889.1 hypothetical protein CAPTEDRAFT_120919 [Capitella teleta]
MSLKELVFEDHTCNEEDSITVLVPEVLDPSYGMYLWPCAPVLAQFIWFHRNHVKGKTILELGAGSSLPGIVAAKVGGHVTLSDGLHLANCLQNCQESVSLNHMSCSINIIGITWGSFNREMCELEPIYIILGSDCFYNTKDFEDLFVTISFFFERNPKAEFWTTYQVRSSQRSLEHLLEKWGMTCFHIPLESFKANVDDIAGSGLPGCHTVQMLVIKLKS